jgi:multidrug efflux pump subunit AcrB
MASGKKKIVTKAPRDKLLPKLTIFFFDKALLTAFLWVVLVIFGALSYTTLLRKEGFPSVNIPITIVNGTYFVNDPAKVDTEVAKPIADIALKRSEVKSIEAHSASNFFVIQVQYEEGTDATATAKLLEEEVKTKANVPKAAIVNYGVPYFGATGGDFEQIDVAVSFYSKDDATPLADVADKAKQAVDWLNSQKLAHVQSVFIKNPYQQVTDPATGQEVTVQRTFDRFGRRDQNATDFHNSVIIGMAKTSGADVIKLDAEVRNALTKLEQQTEFQGYAGEVSASFAPNIKENINELQRVLLEGLIAVLVVGSIVIAIRASLITVLAMVTVLLSTLGLLYLIGYSLNVITLFGLILSLALIVDDTIIMTEAIDAARTHQKDRRQAVKEATRRISRAMVAATATASLSFAPLLFVGGILGSFIRAIPITIISALIISLLVSLLFIPFMARFLLLGKKQMGKMAEKELAAGFEKSLAEFIARPMVWARNSRRKLFGVGLTAVVIGMGFLFAGIVIAKDVVFNIFPPTKDTNGLVLTIQFPPTNTIEQANETSAQVDEIAARELGDNFVHSSYYATGSAQSAMEQIEIVSYTKRKITSPQLVKQLQAVFDRELKDAKVVVGQADVGPPTNAFIVELDATNRQAAFKAADDLAAFMNKTELKRLNGKTAHFTNTTVSSAGEYIRSDDKSIVTVSSGFDGNDSSTLITLAQTAVKKEFTPEKLATYGLNAEALNFNIGQESENQDSFKTLALAFPILLIVIYFLLALQFRSFLQPLLIFMAIPFSIFGVMLGLRLTDNAISFFTMLGFFALVGLSIKNTILLTDYANQARHSGMSAIDAAVAALEERFRPLFATSVTAVVSLIPLAITSPFWQGLAVVLICGLLSSTFLVVTVFPYYYLGAEYLRLRIRRRDFFTWLFIVVVLSVVVGKLATPAIGLSIIPLSWLYLIIYAQIRRRLLIFLA